MAKEAFDFELGMREVYHPHRVVEGVFGISQQDLRTHLYVVGKTGTGKSTLLRSIIRHAIEHNIGVGVLDPHGTLVDEILEGIPPERVDDAIVFAPADRDWPVSLNLLRCAPDPSTVASGLVEAFEGLFGSSWGPRLEWILFCSIASLAAAKNTSLLGIERLLVDATYRQQITRQVTDPVIQFFWREEFERWNERYRREAIAPIQNKIGQVFASPLLRNVLGQVTGRIDMRTVMDTPGSIFLANLSKGALGDDKANVMGSFLVSVCRLAAMQREDTPEEDRRDFVLIADEFQNFVTGSFANALSEVRKYRLNLVLANQYSKQVREDIMDAVFGNVGSIISFRVGHHDATLLEHAFAPDVPANQFLNLRRHQVLARIQKNGMPGFPFIGRTLRHEPVAFGQRAAILHGSRARYARPRREVEEHIQRFLRHKNPP